MLQGVAYDIASRPSTVHGGGAAARGIIQEGNTLECNVKHADAWFEVFKFSLLQKVSFFVTRIDMERLRNPNYRRPLTMLSTTC